MHKRWLWWLWWLAGLLSASILCVNQPADAAGSVTVAPAFIRLSVSESAPEQSATITVKNDYEVPVAFTSSIMDVDQVSGSLVPVSTPDFPLKNLISITPAAFTLEPGKAINITVAVHTSKQLSPGGHYAAIVVRQSTPETGAVQVPLEPAVSVAAFVVKEDGAVRNAVAAIPAPPRIVTSIPTEYNVTFTTTGNVDIVPSAEISLVRRISTNVYAKGVANTSAAPLYPGSTLRLRTELTSIKKPTWPGKYAWLVRARYQGQANATETAYWFWYVPWWFIGAITLLVFGGTVGGMWLIRHKPLRRAFAVRFRRITAKPMKSSAKGPMGEQTAEVTSAAPTENKDASPKTGRVAPGLDMIRPQQFKTKQKSQLKRSAKTSE